MGKIVTHGGALICGVIVGISIASATSGPLGSGQAQDGWSIREIPPGPHVDGSWFDLITLEIDGTTGRRSFLQHDKRTGKVQVMVLERDLTIRFL